MTLQAPEKLVSQRVREGFVTGHDFSRAEFATEPALGFSP
jgi:hypothetical protein